MMNRQQPVRQQISELADGELDLRQMDGLLVQLTASTPNALRDDWDIYHLIGDCLRSEQLAEELSADFSKKFSERLQSEPTLLIPKQDRAPGPRKGWRVVLTAVAAAATGFALMPSVFHAPTGNSPSPMPFTRLADNPPSSLASATLADAGSAIAHGREVDYVLLHHSANPSLYSPPTLVRQAAFSSGTEK